MYQGDFSLFENSLKSESWFSLMVFNAKIQKYVKKSSIAEGSSKVTLSEYSLSWRTDFQGYQRTPMQDQP